MGKFLLIVSLAVLAGCTATPSEDAQTVGGAGGSASVQEVRLSDGTRCVVVVGAYKAGVDCDWSRR